jgi:DNA-binding winged helix-turn-helix (wHTH) protein/Flp pilus assembly protein TadD
LSSRNSSIYEFGGFVLDADEKALRRGGNLVPLAPKAVETLLVLVQNGGRLVTKDDLMQTVWHDAFVEETGLTRNISVLRKTLGETDKSQPRFIETLPKRGYRFIAEIKKTAPIDDAAIHLTNSSPTLAILPFRNLNGAADEDYLGLGLADALITRLSNVRQIVVRPTSAVHNYDSTAENPFETGKKLGVEYILEGGILQAGENRKRITVQFLSVSEARPLWGEKFDEETTDILKLQDSLSERVASTIVKNLSGAEKIALEKHPTTNDEAYREYLHGRFHWNKRTAEGLQKAVRHFENAVALDPNFALAYAAMGEAYVLFAQFFIFTPKESSHLAEKAALNALALDETLAEAHATLAQVAYIYDWDWTRGEEKFRHAISLNPNYANAHHWFALCLAAMRRFDESLSEFAEALRLDPLSLIINRNLALILMFKGDYAAALEQSRKVIELDPSFAFSYLGYSLTLLRLGRIAEAVAAIEHGCELSNRLPNFLCSLGVTYIRAGRSKEAEKILREMHAAAEKTPIPAVEFAILYTHLGKIDEGFEWLEKSCENHESSLSTLILDPDFAPFWKEKNFGEFVRRMNLEEFFLKAGLNAKKEFVAR